MAEQRVFHSAVFSRRYSSGFDCKVASISLICATIGRSVRTSRSFFEPTISLMMNPIMRTVSKQARNATGRAGVRQKELGVGRHRGIKALHRDADPRPRCPACRLAAETPDTGGSAQSGLGP